MKYNINIIFLCMLIDLYYSFKYSTPGSKYWPSKYEILQFKSSLKSNVLLGDEINSDVYYSNIYNTIKPMPSIIVEVIETEDVIKTLQFAKLHKIRIFAKSTGHHIDYSGLEKNSIYLNMSKMRNIQINLEDKTITVETGNPSYKIMDTLREESNGKLIVPTGTYNTVGPYGWSIGGGLGIGTRYMGLGADNILSAQIILANSTIVTASEKENTDLLRALRGSGGSPYGIAINLTFKLYDNPGEVYKFKGIYECNDKISIRFSKFMSNAHDSISSYFFPENENGNCKLLIFIYCWKDCNNIFDEFYDDCLYENQDYCTLQKKTWYEAAYVENNEHVFFNIFFRYSSYVYSTTVKNKDIEKATLIITNFVKSNQNSMCGGSAVLGGKAQYNDPNQSLTTISPELRNSLMQVTCVILINNKDSYSKNLKRIKYLDDFGENVLKKFSPFVYWNEAQHNFPKNDWRERFWGSMENYKKLLDVKKKYDPENFFSCYNCVGYEESGFCPEISIYPRKKKFNSNSNC